MISFRLLFLHLVSCSRFSEEFILLIQESIEQVTKQSLNLDQHWFVTLLRTLLTSFFSRDVTTHQSPEDGVLI